MQGGLGVELGGFPEIDGALIGQGAEGPDVVHRTAVEVGGGAEADLIGSGVLYLLAGVDGHGAAVMVQDSDGIEVALVGIFTHANGDTGGDIHIQRTGIDPDLTVAHMEAVGPALRGAQVDGDSGLFAAHEEAAVTHHDTRTVVVGSFNARVGESTGFHRQLTVVVDLDIAVLHGDGADIIIDAIIALFHAGDGDRGAVIDIQIIVFAVEADALGGDGAVSIPDHDAVEAFDTVEPTHGGNVSVQLCAALDIEHCATLMADQCANVAGSLFAIFIEVAVIIVPVGGILRFFTMEGIMILIARTVGGDVDGDTVIQHQFGLVHHKGIEGVVVLVIFGVVGIADSHVQDTLTLEDGLDTVVEDHGVILGVGDGVGSRHLNPQILCGQEVGIIPAVAQLQLAQVGVFQGQGVAFQLVIHGTIDGTIEEISQSFLQDGTGFGVAHHAGFGHMILFIVDPQERQRFANICGFHMDTHMVAAMDDIFSIFIGGFIALLIQLIGLEVQLKVEALHPVHAVLDGDLPDIGIIGGFHVYLVPAGQDILDLVAFFVEGEVINALQLFMVAVQNEIEAVFALAGHSVAVEIGFRRSLCCAEEAVVAVAEVSAHFHIGAVPFGRNGAFLVPAGVIAVQNPEILVGGVIGVSKAYLFLIVIKTAEDGGAVHAVTGIHRLFHPLTVLLVPDLGEEHRTVNLHGSRAEVGIPLAFADIPALFTALQPVEYQFGHLANLHEIFGQVDVTAGGPVDVTPHLRLTVDAQIGIIADLNPQGGVRVRIIVFGIGRIGHEPFGVDLCAVGDLQRPAGTEHQVGQMELRPILVDHQRLRLGGVVHKQLMGRGALHAVADIRPHLLLRTVPAASAVVIHDSAGADDLFHNGSNVIPLLLAGLMAGERHLVCCQRAVFGQSQFLTVEVQILVIDHDQTGQGDVIGQPDLFHAAVGGGFQFGFGGDFHHLGHITAEAVLAGVEVCSVLLAAFGRPVNVDPQILTVAQFSGASVKGDLVQVGGNLLIFHCQILCLAAVDGERFSLVDTAEVEHIVPCQGIQLKLGEIVRLVHFGGGVEAVTGERHGDGQLGRESRSGSLQRDFVAPFGFGGIQSDKLRAVALACHSLFGQAVQHHGAFAHGLHLHRLGDPASGIGVIIMEIEDQVEHLTGGHGAALVMTVEAVLGEGDHILLCGFIPAPVLLQPAQRQIGGVCAFAGYDNIQRQGPPVDLVDGVIFTVAVRLCVAAVDLIQTRGFGVNGGLIILYSRNGTIVAVAHKPVGSEGLDVPAALIFLPIFHLIQTDGHVLALQRQFGFQRGQQGIIQRRGISGEMVAFQEHHGAVGADADVIIVVPAFTIAMGHGHREACLCAAVAQSTGLGGGDGDLVHTVIQLHHGNQTVFGVVQGNTCRIIGLVSVDIKAHVEHIVLHRGQGQLVDGIVLADLRLAVEAHIPQTGAEVGGQGVACTGGSSGIGPVPLLQTVADEVCLIGLLCRGLIGNDLGEVLCRHTVDGKDGLHGRLRPVRSVKIPDKEDAVFLAAGVAVVPVVVVVDLAVLGGIMLHKAVFRAFQPCVLQTGPVACGMNLTVKLNLGIGRPVQVSVHARLVSHLQGGAVLYIHQQFAGLLTLILGLLVIHTGIMDIEVIGPQDSALFQHQYGVVKELHRLQIQLGPGAVHGQGKGLVLCKAVGDDAYHLQPAVGGKTAHVAAQCIRGHALGKIDQAGPVILIRNPVQGGHAEVQTGNVILFLAPVRPLKHLQNHIIRQRQVCVVTGKIQHRVHAEDAVHFFGQILCCEGDIVGDADGTRAALDSLNQTLCITDTRDNIGHMVRHGSNFLPHFGLGVVLGARGEAKIHRIPHFGIIGEVVVEDDPPHLVAHVLDVVPVLTFIGPPVDDLEGGISRQINVELVGPVAVLTVEEPCTVRAQIVVKIALRIAEEAQLGQTASQGHRAGEGFTVAVHGNIGAELVHVHLTEVGIFLQNGHGCPFTAVGRPNHGRISIGDGGIIIIILRFFIPDGGEEGQTVLPGRSGVDMMLEIAVLLPFFSILVPIEPFCRQMGPVTLKFQLSQINLGFAGPVTTAPDIAFLGHQGCAVLQHQQNIIIGFMAFPDLRDIQPAHAEGGSFCQHQLRTVLNQQVFHISIGQIGGQGDHAGGVVFGGGRKDQVGHLPAGLHFVRQIVSQNVLITVEHTALRDPVAVLVFHVVDGVGKHTALGVERHSLLAVQPGVGKAHGAVEEGGLCTFSHPQVGTLHHQNAGAFRHHHLAQRDFAADIEILVLFGSDSVAEGVRQLGIVLHHQLQTAGGVQFHTLAQRQLVGIILVLADTHADGVIGFQILRQGDIGTDHQKLLDFVFGSFNQVVLGFHIARRTADLHMERAAVVPIVVIGPPTIAALPAVFPQQLAFTELFAGDGQGIKPVFVLILDAHQTHIVPEPFGAVGITEPAVSLIVIEHKVEHTGSGAILGQRQMVGTQLGSIGDPAGISVPVQLKILIIFIQPDGHILTVNIEPCLFHPVVFDIVSNLNLEVCARLHGFGVDGHGIQAGIFVRLTHHDITVGAPFSVIVNDPLHILRLLIHMAHPDRQILIAAGIPRGVGQTADEGLGVDVVFGIEAQTGQFHMDRHGQPSAVGSLPTGDVLLLPLQTGQLDKGPVVGLAAGGTVRDLPQLHAADFGDHRLIMPFVFIKILSKEDQAGLVQCRCPDLALGLFRFAPQGAILVGIPHSQPVDLQMGIASGDICAAEVQIGAGGIADIAPDEGLTGDGDGGVVPELQQDAVGVFGVPIAEQRQLAHRQLNALVQHQTGLAHQIQALGLGVTQKQRGGVLVGLAHQRQDVVFAHSAAGQLADRPAVMLVQHGLNQLQTAAQIAHPLAGAGVFHRHQTVIVTDALLKITGFRTERDGVAHLYQYILSQIQTTGTGDAQHPVRIQRHILAHIDLTLGEHHQHGRIRNNVFGPFIAFCLLKRIHLQRQTVRSGEGQGVLRRNGQGCTGIHIDHLVGLQIVAQNDVGSLHDVDLVHILQQGGFERLLTVHESVLLGRGLLLKAVFGQDILSGTALRLLGGAHISAAEEQHALLFRLHSHSGAQPHHHGQRKKHGQCAFESLHNIASKKCA